MQDDRDSWELDADIPAAVHNARLLLVLLRCIRSLPKAFPQHAIHTLEECLGPLRSRLGEREIKVLNAVGQGLKPLIEDDFPEDDEAHSTGKADRLDKLGGLTPGDYANVARRLRRMALSSVTERWIDELEAEFAAKSQGPKTALGFL